jgi:hypothetical protein
MEKDMTEPTGTRMDLFEWRRGGAGSQALWVLEPRNVPGVGRASAVIHVNRSDPTKYAVAYVTTGDAPNPNNIERLYGIESESLAKETIETLINLNIAKGRAP